MLARAHSGISPSGGGLLPEPRAATGSLADRVGQPSTAAWSCDRGEFGPDRIRDGGTVEISAMLYSPALAFSRPQPTMQKPT